MSIGSPTRRGFAAAALLVVVALSAPAARGATPEDRAAARQHFSQAQKLKKQGQLAQACAQLREVERLDSKLPTLLELAECTEQLGKVVEAQALWIQARDRAKHDEKPQSRARAEERLAAIQKRVARLTLQLAAPAPEAQVLRDETPLDAASLGVPLLSDPGEHVIVVKLAGHDDARYTVKLSPGDDQTLAITAGPVTSASSAPPAAPLVTPVPSSPPPPVTSRASAPAVAEPPHATGWWSTPRKVGAILGAAGVVGVGGGTALCLTADSGKADASLALGGASIAAGGVLLISGILLLVSGSSDESASHAKVRVTPTLALSPDRTFLGARAEF